MSISINHYLYSYYMAPLISYYIMLHHPPLSLISRKLRDELSHNLFLMLQECNKFREHQAREILIATLEQQLNRKKDGLAMLREQINEADDALIALQKFRES